MKTLREMKDRADDKTFFKLFQKEFLITNDTFICGYYTSEIEMNNYSLSLAFKSLFATNKRAFYLCRLINLFQKIPMEKRGEPIYYSAYSHAMTIYFLRILAKCGLVEIVEYRKKGTTSCLKNYYEIIGNDEIKSRTKMHQILFIKKRNLTKDEFDLVKRIMKSLKIPEEYITIKITNGLLSVSINTIEKIKALCSKEFPKEVEKRLNYFIRHE